MWVKVSDTVLPPITGLCITLGHIWRLWPQWEDNSTHPSLPYSAITLKIDCLGQFSKLHTLRKRNMCMNVSDTVLSPITGLHITYGTYTEALGTLRMRNMCVKVSDTVLPPISSLRITFITYTEALGTMGR